MKLSFRDEEGGINPVVFLVVVLTIGIGSLLSLLEA